MVFRFSTPGKSKAPAVRRERKRDYAGACGELVVGSLIGTSDLFSLRCFTASCSLVQAAATTHLCNCQSCTQHMGPQVNGAERRSRRSCNPLPILPTTPFSCTLGTPERAIRTPTTLYNTHISKDVKLNSCEKDHKVFRIPFRGFFGRFSPSSALVARRRKQRELKGSQNKKGRLTSSKTV